MRVAEERLNTGFAGQLLMFGELAAVIKGDGVPGPFGQTAEAFAHKHSNRAPRGKGEQRMPSPASF